MKQITKQEALDGIAAMQRVQETHPPESQEWLRASRILHKLATIVNGGVEPKDACGGRA